VLVSKLHPLVINLRLGGKFTTFKSAYFYSNDILINEEINSNVLSGLKSFSIKIGLVILFERSGIE
jgi:hypothetical protein